MNTCPINKTCKIEFEVMGLDDITSEYLNWCIEHRDYVEWARDNKYNLDFVRECKTMEAKSREVKLHFDGTCFIRKIEDVKQYKRLKIA